MPTLEQRSRYRAGLGITWLLLPALIVGALLAALALAWCLKFAFVHGWYLIMLLPIFGGLALGGAISALIGWTHCRNRWLAGTLGLAAGLVGYLGYYELCLLDLLPPAAAGRLDLLPRYIAFRMQTDVAGEVGKPNLGKKPKEPAAVMNWVTFAMELMLVVGAAAWLAWNRARRAYCPELGKWMHQEKALLPPQSSTGLLEALEAGRLGEFVAAAPAAGDPQAASHFLLEYAVPAGGSPLSHPVYASLESLPLTRPWHGLRKIRSTLLRQVQLEVDEVLTLRPLFPNLARLLAAQHAELRDLPSGVTPAASTEAPTSDLAQITPVPDPYRQRVRSRGYALWVNLIGLTPVVYFFGGIGALAGGIWLAMEKGVPLGWALAALGAASFLWGGYMGLYCLCVAENRWINRRLRQEIAQRPDPLVDPRDSESQYVSLIPRESFAKVQLTMSSDLLLLKIQDRERRVLMEGDSDRYRIPGGAIAACEAQCFFHPIDAQHRNELWMVRLVINVQEGSRELLLSANPTGWGPVTNARRRQIAEQLCQRINGLRGQIT